MPRCTVGIRQAEHKSQGVDGRGRYGNEAIALKGDEPMRREGLQARGIYKEVLKDPLQLYIELYIIIIYYLISDLDLY